jgi:hypothetical protein
MSGEGVIHVVMVACHINTQTQRPPNRSEEGVVAEKKYARTSVYPTEYRRLPGGR